jgi:DNA-binding XRE family transcriptional regulator
MLRPEQVRAARALLDWSQQELADRAGTARMTIRHIEEGTVQPQRGTLADIVKVFDDHGIEFIGDHGVSLRRDQVVTLKGENIFFRVLDDVIATLRAVPGAEALFACVEDRRSPPAVVENYRRLREAGIAMRSLVREGDSYLMGKPREYRCLPEKFFHNTASVIYGDKFATMTLDQETGEDAGAVIIRNSHVAAAQRNLFNFIWSVARAPKATSAEVRYDE